MAALIDATTGVTATQADLDDTTPQYGSADSLTNVVPATLTYFLWPSFVLTPGTKLNDGSGGTSLESWGVLG